MGKPARAMDIPFNLVLNRMVSCPRVVEEMLQNFGGHVMSAEERAANNVPDQHITPIPTELADKAYETYMDGELLRSSSHMGLECIVAGDGARVYVGDTIMARISRCSNPQPCRLAALFWRDLRKRDPSELQLAGGGADLLERLGLQDGKNRDGGGTRGGDSSHGDYNYSSDRGDSSDDSGGSSSDSESDSGGSSSSSSSSSSTGNSGSNSSNSSSSSSSGSNSSSTSSTSSTSSSENGDGNDDATVGEDPTAERRRTRSCRRQTAKGKAYAETLAASFARKEKKSEDTGPGRSGSDEDNMGSSNGYLVVRVNRLLSTRTVGREFNPKRRRDDKGYPHVWELTNDPMEIRARDVVGLCSVMQPGDEPVAEDEGASAYHVGEFIERRPRTGEYQAVMTPWRREGYHGWFFDRRSSGVYSNVTRLPVFSAELARTLSSILVRRGRSTA